MPCRSKAKKASILQRKNCKIYATLLGLRPTVEICHLHNVKFGGIAPGLDEFTAGEKFYAFCEAAVQHMECKHKKFMVPLLEGFANYDLQAKSQESEHYKLINQEILKKQEQTNKFVAVSMGWEGHSIGMAECIHEGVKYLLVCNRGDRQKITGRCRIYTLKNTFKLYQKYPYEIFKKDITFDGYKEWFDGNVRPYVVNVQDISVFSLQDKGTCTISNRKGLILPALKILYPGLSDIKRHEIYKNFTSAFREVVLNHLLKCFRNEIRDIDRTTVLYILIQYINSRLSENELLSGKKIQLDFANIRRVFSEIKDILNEEELSDIEQHLSLLAKKVYDGKPVLKVPVEFLFDLECRYTEILRHDLQQLKNLNLSTDYYKTCLEFMDILICDQEMVLLGKEQAQDKLDEYYTKVGTKYYKQMTHVKSIFSAIIDESSGDMKEVLGNILDNLVKQIGYHASFIFYQQKVLRERIRLEKANEDTKEFNSMHESSNTERLFLSDWGIMPSGSEESPMSDKYRKKPPKDSDSESTKISL